MLPLLALLVSACALVPARRAPPHKSPLVERLKANVTCDICKLFAVLFDEGLRLNWTETTFLSAAADLCAAVPLGFSKGFCDGMFCWCARLRCAHLRARRRCAALRTGRVPRSDLRAGQHVGQPVLVFASVPGGQTGAITAQIAAQTAKAEEEKEKTYRWANCKTFGLWGIFSRASTDDDRAQRRIVQFTDMHFDQYYAAGSSQSSPGYTLACRSEFGTAPPIAGPYGGYGAPGAPYGCDTPLPMLQSAYNYLSQLPYPIDAVLLTVNDAPKRVCMAHFDCFVAGRFCGARHLAEQRDGDCGRGGVCHHPAAQHAAARAAQQSLLRAGYARAPLRMTRMTRDTSMLTP